MQGTSFGAIHTKNSQMKKVIQIAENVAPSRAAILIEGASGTGKELLAKHIHSKSHRSNRKLVVINCSAQAEMLLESELISKIEMANGGTLLLEDVSELPLPLQAKLLRIIQENEVERPGHETMKLNLRIISTSSKDLKKMVEKAQFREDLYYRLNVIRLTVPDLRMRKDDIQLLTSFFVEVSSLVNDRKIKPIHSAAMEKLMSWNWPGNVRELESVIERAVLLSQTNEIMAEDIEIENLIESPKGEGFVAGMTISEAERHLIMKTLEFTRNNRTQAARMLGISIRTLRNKLNFYKGAALI